MSQSGKILHLYVEVRSVPDEEGKDIGDVEKTDSLMLTAPDIIQQSQFVGPNGPHGRISPRGVLHKGGSSTQSLASCKSTSRHSVSFQLHPGIDSDQSTTQHQRNLPYDEISQLLSVLQTGPTGNKCHLVCSPSERDSFCREPHLSGRFTAPPTPSGTRKAFSPIKMKGGDEGRRSIATFSYIEKAQIKSVESQFSSLCQNEPQNPFKKNMEDRATPHHLKKRLSDPVWFNSVESMNNCNSKQLSQGLANSHIGNPSFRRATLDVAREATHKALNEFGSSQLRHKLASNCPDKGHDIRRVEQRRCRSWSGSPVIPSSSRTLPIKATIMDHERDSSLYRIPRSPATDQLSNHAKQAYFTMSNSTVNTQEVSNQRVQGSRLRLNLPSCKPTAIQHELPAKIVTQSPSNQQISHSMSDSPRQSHRVNFHLANSKTKVDKGANQLSEKRNVSPATSPETARKLAEEATKLSVLMEARRSPSPTPSSSDTLRSDSPQKGHLKEPQDSEAQTHSNCNLAVHEHNRKKDSVKNGHQFVQTTPLLPNIRSTSPAAPARLNRSDIKSSSPIRDPRIERTQLVGKDSPTLHRHLSTQYTRDNHTPTYDTRLHDTLRGHKDSPDSIRKSFTRPNPETSVTWTSEQRLEHGLEECFTRDKESLMEVNNQKRNSPATPGSQDNHYRLSVQHSELKGHSRAQKEWSGTASQSSSGVTGSPVESSLHEKNYISPEISSRTSQKSSDSGNTAIQRPSLHSQKIARAKWEFLFGSHSEDQQTKGVNFLEMSNSDSHEPVL